MLDVDEGLCRYVQCLGQVYRGVESAVMTETGGYGIAPLKVAMMASLDTLKGYV